MPHDPLLTQRAALVLLLAALTGIGAGVLTAWQGHGAAAAVGAGLAAFGPGVVFFHLVIA
ncbi:hypothetical protein [Streptomyces sp. enrichment culture]|uniref:hypothetical protein n=1 Tax=Streptomyces sp. enrichment culture TaxID=1795815 RepID=UPI003F5592E4